MGFSDKEAQYVDKFEFQTRVLDRAPTLPTFLFKEQMNRLRKELPAWHNGRQVVIRSPPL